MGRFRTSVISFGCTVMPPVVVLGPSKRIVLVSRRSAATGRYLSCSANATMIPSGPRPPWSRYRSPSVPGRARGRSRRAILGGGDPEPAAVGVPDLDLPRPRGLFHLRAELGLRDYDDQGSPTHDHASTPRDQDRAGVRGTAQRTPLTRR